MSRSGSCYDNAVMERFFWSLKHEWTKHEHFENLAAARLSVFKYIETESPGLSHFGFTLLERVRCCCSGDAVSRLRFS